MSTTDLICTCPSGDGSLRWPCPAHPPEAAPAPAPADLRRAAERAKDLIVSSLCHQTTTRDQWKLVAHLLNKALGEEHDIGKEASNG